MSDTSIDLTFVSTNDLRDEISKRCEAFMFIYVVDWFEENPVNMHAFGNRETREDLLLHGAEFNEAIAEAEAEEFEE